MKRKINMAKTMLMSIIAAAAIFTFSACSCEADMYNHQVAENNDMEQERLVWNLEMKLIHRSPLLYQVYDSNPSVFTTAVRDSVKEFVWFNDRMPDLDSIGDMTNLSSRVQQNLDTWFPGAFPIGTPIGSQPL